MAFSTFFVPYFKQFAKMPAAKVLQARAEEERTAREIERKSGLEPAEIARRAGTDIVVEEPLPPELKEPHPTGDIDSGMARKLLQAQVKRKRAEAETKQATVRAAGKAAVPTALEASILAYARSRNLPVDEKLAAKTALKTALARRKRFTFMLPWLREKKTGDKRQVAITQYVKAISAGLPEVKRRVPEPLRRGVEKRLKAQILPTAPIEHVERAYEATYHDVPVPELLEGL